MPFTHFPPSNCIVGAQAEPFSISPLENLFTSVWGHLFPGILPRYPCFNGQGNGTGCSDIQTTRIFISSKLDITENIDNGRNTSMKVCTSQGRN
jgi:hypothetical protein